MYSTLTYTCFCRFNEIQFPYLTVHIRLQYFSNQLRRYNCFKKKIKIVIYQAGHTDKLIRSTHCEKTFLSKFIILFGVHRKRFVPIVKRLDP
jgi:hypothetical protein